MYTWFPIAAPAGQLVNPYVGPCGAKESTLSSLLELELGEQTVTWKKHQNEGNSVFNNPVLMHETLKFISKES